MATPYSCLENPMAREAWWATVRGGHRESDMTEQLNVQRGCTHFIYLFAFWIEFCAN